MNDQGDLNSSPNDRAHAQGFGRGGYRRTVTDLLQHVRPGLLWLVRR